MPSISKYLVTGVLCVVMVGCTGDVSRDELVGGYSVHNREGKAVLTLKANMTYMQVITFNDGKSQSAFGAWSYDARNHYVTLRDGFVVNENTLSWRVNANMMPVMKSFGKVELEADPDAGLRYVKND